MRSRIVAAGLVAAGMAALGCSKSTTAASTPPPGSATCSMTLSGAISGTYNCLPDYTLFVSKSDSGGFLLSMVANATQPNILVAVAFPGHPAVGDYPSTSASVNGLVNISNSGGQNWTAQSGASGTFDLKYTAIGAGVTDSVGVLYPSVGTLTATLAPVTATSAAGNITMTITF